MNIQITRAKWAFSALVFSSLLACAGISHAAQVSLAIPTYFAPSDTADWTKVENNAAKISIVIVNPGSGPDPNQAAAYQSLYSTLHSKGIKVLGYVHTLGGCRPYNTNYNYTTSPDNAVSGLGVEGDIKEWSREQDVDGIFLDEGPSTGTWSNNVASFSYGGYTYSPNPSLPECSGTTLHYYQPLRAYAQSLSWPNAGTPTITLNPGGPTDEQYLYDAGGAKTQNGVADIIVTAEEYSFPVYAGNNNAWLAGQFATGGGLNWVYGHNASHFWQLCYGFNSNDIDPSTGYNEVTKSITQAGSWQTQYVYYTDSTTPWSTISGATVWNDELSQSAGQLAPPAGGIGFSNESAWDDGVNFYYQATYTGAYSHFHVFLDTDLNTATGYPINGIGADYMIEDTGFYKSTANGTWSWSQVTTTVTETTPTTGTVKFSVPLSALGSPSSAHVAFQGLDASWNPTTDPDVTTYKKTVFAPAAPTGLAAAPGNAQAALSWNASSGATSYNVYRGTSSGAEALLASGITSTGYTNTGLTDGTTYYYKVAAVNSGGTSALSSEVSATPQAPPAAPTNLWATAGNGQAALTWTASSGAASYSVYRGTSSGGESTTPIATGLTSASYTNTGLTNGTTYFYKVVAVNVGGASGMSNEANATPSSGTTTIYNESEAVSGSSVTFQFSYTGSWTYFHVFLDTDLNASTGYTVGGIGADYLIENGGLYKSTANGSGWSWASAGSITYTNSGGVAKFTVPLSSIGSPAHINVVYQVAAGSSSYTTGAFNY